MKRAIVRSGWIVRCAGDGYEVHCGGIDVTRPEAERLASMLRAGGHVPTLWCVSVAPGARVSLPDNDRSEDNPPSGQTSDVTSRPRR